MFDGFLPQMIEYLGPIQWAEEATAHGPNRGYAVLYLCAPGNRIGTAVSNGLRFQRVTVLVPQELCCSLHADQEEVAHRLVVQVAAMVLEGGRGVMSGSIIPGERPFAEGSELSGVICAEHPYADAEFDVVRDADGEVEMQVVTLVPASSAELALAAEQGTDALFDLWEERKIDLADIFRPSAV